MKVKDPVLFAIMLAALKPQSSDAVALESHSIFGVDKGPEFLTPLLINVHRFEKIDESEGNKGKPASQGN